MDKAPLSQSATRRLRLALALLSFNFAPSFAVGAPAQAPNTSEPRPHLERTDSRAAAGSTAPSAAREEQARTTAAVEPTHPAARDSADARNATMLPLLLGVAVTLALVAITAAVLLVRTQAKLNAEKSLRAAIEDEYNALYNRAPLGYHTLDLNGAIVDMNDTEIGWLGYTRDMIIGKRYSEFLEEASWTAFSENYARLLQGDRFDSMERKYQVISKDGNVRSLSFTPSLVRGKDGKVIETRWAAVDVSDTVRLEQALDTEAHFDRVTNAHDRAFFHMLGEREIARARRVSSELTLLYVDVEGFSRVNALYGHFAGDKVLRTVCGVIAQSLRNVDVFARVGDDEFAILLPDTGREGAAIVANRLKNAIASTPVGLSSDDVVEVRAAIGIGEYSEKTPDLDALLTAGEKSLEQARRDASRLPGAEVRESLSTPAS